MGLDISLYNNGESFSNIDSDKYPKHTCGKGYLRSSYNSGGFNNVVSNLIGKDLYYIFEPDSGYEIELSKQKLEDCLKRAKEVLYELENTEKSYKVCTVSHNIFSGISKVSESEAIQIMNKQLNNENLGSYSCADGHFFQKEPLAVVGAIPGIDALGSPCVHLVYESDITWYKQMAEIVIEMIEFAMTLENPKLIWSS